MTAAPPVHLVVGDDARLRSDAARALVAELLGDDDPTLALEEFTLAGRADGADAESAPGADGPPVVDRARSPSAS